MKRKKGSKPTVSYLTQSLKRVGKSVGRRKPASIARQVMCHPRIKKHVIGEVGNLMQEEMKEMCKTIRRLPLIAWDEGAGYELIYL